MSKHIGAGVAGRFKITVGDSFWRSRLFFAGLATAIATIIVMVLLVSKLFAASIVPIATTSIATVVNTNQQILFDSATHNTNVTIDYETRQMTGYAWSTELGWIYFGGGAENTDGPVIADIHGLLSGKAKVLDTGNLIDFKVSSWVHLPL